MTAVAILGSGGIGLALAALLGGRADLEVSLWGRRAVGLGSRTFRCVNAGATCAAGRATVRPDPRSAVHDAAVVVLAVPTDARPDLLRMLAGAMPACRVLLAWEGTGPFREELAAIDALWPACAGLQRSPLVARPLADGTGCDLRGVRSSVVAAAVDADDRALVGDVLGALLPVGIEMAPSYDHVSVSPGNPLIHPARLWAIASGPGEDRAADGGGFYAGWDDRASEILLALHGELARLRDALGLSRSHVRTLVDRDPVPNPARVTAEIRGEAALAEVPVPIRIVDGRPTLDREHRFVREDIGRGLAYVVALARRAGQAMPTAEAIVAWQSRTGR
ncbi:NAD/NADP octopine/nopaline dehydrogenase family protein [Salinarimonas sp. NSM]|uniref:NAD/NADP octopine/nopaline dehydrogenase family protein n=1 Tax=Salinarimonas sp. NSM TaxID=3458003 RepID=UPI004035F9B0